MLMIRTGVSALILAALPLCFGQSSDEARAKLSEQLESGCQCFVFGDVAIARC